MDQSEKQACRDMTGIELSSLCIFGSAYDFFVDYDRAIDFHQQSLTIAREIGDRQGESNSLGNLGYALLSIGE